MYVPSICFVVRVYFVYIMWHYASFTCLDDWSKLNRTLSAFVTDKKNKFEDEIENEVHPGKEKEKKKVAENKKCREKEGKENIPWKRTATANKKGSVIKELVSLIELNELK